MCTGPHTFQHFYGLDSREDVGEIKLRCIVWEFENSDPNHAGPMEEKTKTNWEHFSNNLFIINEEIYVVQKQVYWGVMQGKERRCSATIYSNLQSRHRADLHGNYTDKFTMIENTYTVSTY